MPSFSLTHPPQEKPKRRTFKRGDPSILVRASVEEREKIKEEARKHNMSLNAYCLKRILGHDL